MSFLALDTGECKVKAPSIGAHSHGPRGESRFWPTDATRAGNDESDPQPLDTVRQSVDVTKDNAGRPRRRVVLGHLHTIRSAFNSQAKSARMVPARGGRKHLADTSRNDAFRARGRG